MKRLSSQVKAIADAHINAMMTGKFDDPDVKTKEQVIDQLKAGKTFSYIMELIEARSISVTSIIYQRTLGHVTNAYRKEVYKSFKNILQ
jgi:hypothetical protein